jgi:hypothetical protein
MATFRCRYVSGMKSDLRPSTKAIEMSEKIRNYAELRELIRVSLRKRNPEWIEPNGDSPLCDSYEARFAELLGLKSGESADAG